MNPFRSRIALGVLTAFVGFALTSTTFEAREAQGNSDATKPVQQEGQRPLTNPRPGF